MIKATVILGILSCFSVVIYAPSSGQKTSEPLSPSSNGNGISKAYMTVSALRMASPNAEQTAPPTLSPPPVYIVLPQQIGPPNPAHSKPPPIVALGPAALTRSLQRELRRLGCYGGEINGAWTTSTRRAMQAMLHESNAKLPIDEPDQVLLALVQGEQRQICSKAYRAVPDERQPLRAEFNQVAKPVSSVKHRAAWTAASPPVFRKLPNNGRIAPAAPKALASVPTSHRVGRNAARRDLPQASTRRAESMRNDFASTLFKRLDSQMP